MQELVHLVLRAVKANNGTANVPFRIKTLIQCTTSFYVEATDQDGKPFDAATAYSYLASDIPHFRLTPCIPINSLQDIQIIFQKGFLRKSYLLRNHLLNY